ncbi:MAG TPA: pyridoxal-phosphate dependent enzyme, partial [Burkholderiales bacterium]|nr:pyridoxal-phosphate dependent enzyme [Burkholderiales bacterium]
IKGTLPRLFVTQFEGCAPVVKAFDEGKEACTAWGRIDIPPGGLRSPNPPGGRAVLALMRKHGGAAIAVSTSDALAAVDDLTRMEGIFACPESATTLAGLRKAIAMNLLRPDEDVIIVNTGSGLKSIPALEPARFPVITSSAAIPA